MAYNGLESIRLAIIPDESYKGFECGAMAVYDKATGVKTLPESPNLEVA